MKYTLLILLALVAKITIGQSDSISLDMLQVPSSPAFNILDIAPNSVDRPKNPTDFALALSNASSGFTTIPKNYAIEVAPYWILGKKKATYQDFIANKLSKNLLQTTTLSLGTKDAISVMDSSEFRKMAVALKTSFFRGHLGAEFTRWQDSVYKSLDRITVLQGDAFIALQASDKELTTLQAELKTATDANRVSIQQRIIARNAVLERDAEKIAADSIREYRSNITLLKNLMSRTDFRRYGFKMDYAIGTALDFPGNDFGTSYVSRVSTWLTVGNEAESGISWLFVGRYNYNINRFFRNDADKLVENIRTSELDYGVRVYSDVTSKLTLSLELVGRRRYFNEDKLIRNGIQLPHSTSRQVFTANYKAGRNQNLAFTFGKNFDNTQIREGNLIAALNFLIGFGSSRPAPNK